MNVPYMEALCTYRPPKSEQVSYMDSLSDSSAVCKESGTETILNYP